MSRSTTVTVVLTLMAPVFPLAAAEPPIPQEAVFQVNTETLYTASQPSVVVQAGGEFVVVWLEGAGGFEEGRAATGSVQGRRFDAGGNALGEDFRVDGLGLIAGQRTAIAGDSQGDFVVVWGAPQDGDGLSIQGRRFASSGIAQGDEFTVNTYTTLDQKHAAVARRDDGGFVVVWSGASEFPVRGVPGTFLNRIRGQRFGSDGSALGGEFQVNTFTEYARERPAVAMGPLGEFVVVWEEHTPLFYEEVRARRFSSDGSALGSEMVVSTDPAANQTRPTVALQGSGDFVIVWNGPDPEEVLGYTVLARRYESSGAPIGSEFVVSPGDLLSENRTPDVATTGSDDFVVSWSNEGIQFRAFSSDGTALGGQFEISNDTGYPEESHVRANDRGDFVVTWQAAYFREGFVADVFARRLETPIFADGFESGDTTGWD